MTGAARRLLVPRVLCRPLHLVAHQRAHLRGLALEREEGGEEHGAADVEHDFYLLCEGPGVDLPDELLVLSGKAGDGRRVEAETIKGLAAQAAAERVVAVVVEDDGAYGDAQTPAEEPGLGDDAVRRREVLPRHLQRNSRGGRAEAQSDPEPDDNLEPVERRAGRVRAVERRQEANPQKLEGGADDEDDGGIVALAGGCAGSEGGQGAGGEEGEELESRLEGVAAVDYLGALRDDD